MCIYRPFCDLEHILHQTFAYTKNRSLFYKFRTVDEIDAQENSAIGDETNVCYFHAFIFFKWCHYAYSISLSFERVK
jgi:hypothetical protein